MKCWLLQALLKVTKVVPITAGIPQTLTPSPRYYRGFILWDYRNKCPHYRGNYRGNRAITAIPIPMPIFNSRSIKLFSCEICDKKFTQYNITGSLPCEENLLAVKFQICDYTYMQTQHITYAEWLFYCKVCCSCSHTHIAMYESTVNCMCKKTVTYNL